MKQFLTICILLFTLQTGFAQSPVPAPLQQQPVALTGATIHTLAGNAIQNGTILFENGVITALGRSVDIPANAVTEDVSGKHIYPGLIDSYSQMGLFEIGSIDMTLDINEQGSINPNVMTERAFHPESRHIAIARSAGILTAISSPGGGLISGQTAAMRMEGWTWEEMTLQSGIALLINWPTVGSQKYEENLATLQNVFDDARAYRKARQAAEEEEGRRVDMDTRWESMIPVFNNERPLLVNANQADQIQDAITWAAAEDLDIIILGGRDSHLVTEHLKKHQIPVVVTTVITSSRRAWEPYDNQYSLPAKLYQAGVQFAISGGASAPYAHRLPYEAGTAAAFGLPMEEALKALTVYPAGIFGLSDRIGTLEPGKNASLLITTGNPLEYETQIEQVYIDGRKSSMTDMHRQLYQKYREKVDASASASGLEE